MTTPRGPEDVEFHLLTRDSEGEYISTAEAILSDRGIPSYTQRVRPTTQGLTTDEEGLLNELQELLPADVHLPADNPFLVLKISPPLKELGADGEVCDCLCMCGSADACGGSGGGSCRPM